MNISQFVNSLSIIYRSEHTNRSAALLRHIAWQRYKFHSTRRIERRLSQSVLTDDEPGGVIGLVNMLGLYDYNNMNLVRRLLGPGDVFVDVGANVGAYTLVASEQPEALIIALEPNPTAFTKLLRNVSVNQRRNVIALRRAASSAKGVLRMTNRGSDPTNCIVLDSDRENTIEVEIDTLDAICAQHDAKPTIIKMDVEGHEPDVIEGATRILAATAVCIVENGERGAVTRAMRECGLRGPFYYNHERGCMSNHPQVLAEDAVFIGASFEERLPSISFAAR
jgi:FkbM family methyltransferase